MIDAHMHFGDDSPLLLDFMVRRDLRFLNICITTGPGWRTQASRYADLSRRYPQRFAWCTSFDLPEPGETNPLYSKRICRQLTDDFGQGALACKIWKNAGLVQRKQDGSFLLPDDPRLEPVLEFLTTWNRPLLCHIADPLEAWLPLNPDHVHYSYFSRHPEWHQHEKPGIPSHRCLIEARNRVLARHPGLRVIGAHLGSQELSLYEVAATLDRFPNYAVDISARLGNLARHPRDTLRRFFITYADRVLFGTDHMLNQSFSAMPTEAGLKILDNLAKSYDLHRRFLESRETFSLGNRKVQGLDLPEGVLRKLYHQSAKHWYPGL